MAFKVLTNLLDVIIQCFKLPLIAISAFIILYVIIINGFIFYGILVKKKKLPKGAKSLKKRNFLIRLFWDAPKQYVEDMFSKPDNFFGMQGLIVFCGRQGNGKTSSVVRQALDLHTMYPMAKAISNIRYKYQNDSLKHWKQLINYKNGTNGVIVIMDELQNWFNSNQSKNFPPEMLSVITQNRKNRRVILATAQSFHLLSKAIRTQTVEVRDCLTLLGCITIVRRREPVLNAEGDVDKWKNRGIYFYVHSKELREAYDTYEVVQNLSSSGFKDEVPEVNIAYVK